MTEVLAWQNGADNAEAIQRAAQILTAGGLVAFPTETVYGIGAAGWLPDAVARLDRAKDRAPDKPWAVALPSWQQALAWAPRLSALGRRLARRCWPGPVTIVTGDGVEAGMVCELPAAIQRRICPKGEVGLRVPDHDAVYEALRVLPGPLLLTSANRGGEPPATTAEAVRQALGDELGLIIDDGPCRLGQASTVVKIAGTSWEVLREGAMPTAALRELAATLIVFVCTGNTCRSPLAEGFCRKLLAERLGCALNELAERGFFVQSAGIAAMMGSAATPEAVAVAHDYDVDLSGHRSQFLSPQLAAQADYLVAMTQSHLQLLAGYFSGLAAEPRLLCPDGRDLDDPIGGDETVYRACAQDILRSLETLVPEFQSS